MVWQRSAASCRYAEGNLTCTQEDPPAWDEESNSWQSCCLTGITLGAKSLHFRQLEGKGSTFGTSQAIRSRCHVPLASSAAGNAKKTGCARGCVSHFAALRPTHTASEAIYPQTPRSGLRVLSPECREVFILTWFWFFFFKPSYKPRAFLLLPLFPAASVRAASGACPWLLSRDSNFRFAF